MTPLDPDGEVRDLLIELDIFWLTKDDGLHMPRCSIVYSEKCNCQKQVSKIESRLLEMLREAHKEGFERGLQHEDYARQVDKQLKGKA